MSKRYGSFDDAAPPDPAETSEPEQGTRRLRRRIGPGDEDGTRMAMNTLRLRGMVFSNSRSMKPRSRSVFITERVPSSFGPIRRRRRRVPCSGSDTSTGSGGSASSKEP